MKFVHLDNFLYVFSWRLATKSFVFYQYTSTRTFNWDLTTSLWYSRKYVMEPTNVNHLFRVAILTWDLNSCIFFDVNFATITSVSPLTTHPSVISALWNDILILLHFTGMLHILASERNVNSSGIIHLTCPLHFNKGYFSGCVAFRLCLLSKMTIETRVKVKESYLIWWVNCVVCNWTLKQLKYVYNVLSYAIFSSYCFVFIHNYADCWTR